MHLMTVNFRPISELMLESLIGMTGVYVIWESTENRPTYIGEGNLLKCFGNHFSADSDLLGLPVEGYVALIGSSQDARSSRQGKALKRLLLEVASDIDRAPKVRAKSEREDVLELVRAEGDLRISMCGYDPLTAPGEALPLVPTREITAWMFKGADDYWMEHSRTIPAALYRLPKKRRIESLARG